MNYWQEFDIEYKVVAILSNVGSKGHHLGRPFLTAYQIAIEFTRLHPGNAAALNIPIDERGAGVHHTLSTYLAKQLSDHIKDGSLQNVEGGFLSNLYLNDISFTSEDEPISSSLTGTNSPLSIFRLRD
jgi:hypothetical protein